MKVDGAAPVVEVVPTAVVFVDRVVVGWTEAVTGTEVGATDVYAIVLFVSETTMVLPIETGTGIVVVGIGLHSVHLVMVSVSVSVSLAGVVVHGVVISLVVSLAGVFVVQDVVSQPQDFSVWPQVSASVVLLSHHQLAEIVGRKAMIAPNKKSVGERILVVCEK